METAILLGAISVLAGAIGVLWKRDQARVNRELDELYAAIKKCDEERALLWKAVIKLQGGSCSVVDCDERCPLKLAAETEVLKPRDEKRLERPNRDGRTMRFLRRLVH